jgi:hypothetical protein
VSASDPQGGRLAGRSISPPLDRCGRFRYLKQTQTHHLQRRDAPGSRGCFEPPGFEAGNVTITRVGTNQRYSDGWDVAFGGKRGGSASQSKKKPTPSKKAAPKKKSKR